MLRLEQYGWSAAWQRKMEEFDEQGLIPARVITADRGEFKVVTADGERTAVARGRTRLSDDPLTYPTVGDWVLCLPEPAGTMWVQGLLTRKSQLTRQAPGRVTKAKTVAANVDTVFCVTSLNRDFNPRRLERYLTATWDGGAQPFIVLTKADLCEDAAAFTEALPPAAFGLPVAVISALESEGLDALLPACGPGQTVAVLGSSGVGKSTLINALIGIDRQAVSHVREGDSKGRHTTTRRELIALPSGGLIIDTPGMREFALWDSPGEGLEKSFGDLAALAEGCGFRDCTHQGEPDCAIRAALDAGELDMGRWQSFQKLAREQAYQERRKDASAQRENQRLWRSRTLAMRQRYKVDGGKK